MLIAGLFHATFNSTINPGGFALTVLNLEQDEAFVILRAILWSPEPSSPSRPEVASALPSR